ncbi:MAG: YunC family protein [Candidatus Omnitrophica bacterium]|nr:YunC family protein [Candidatus Omnitrophota bacterium]
MNLLQQKKIVLAGGEAMGYCCALPQAVLVYAVAPRGFIMCGYLDIQTADKFNDAACVVSGVATIDELLARPVVRLTRAAEQRGVTTGMSGREALEKFFV